jgi:lysophospholipase L1-like esterase
MDNIPKIDRNFATHTSLNIDNIRFYNIQENPFSLFGVFFENGIYRRLPEQVAKSVSESVYALHAHTAGGRVKFVTDSQFIAIKAVMPAIGKMPHFALTGSAGFDLYVGRQEEYYSSFVPPFDISDGYESVIRFDKKTEREITINFPLYSSVADLYIGLDENAVLKKSRGYKHKKPIVFYGSSITQGGCASRPGNAYESIISRALQTDYINLGFSGNAKAEDEIAQYIKDLDMSVFIYDYDHNAPNLKHLEDTHQRMFSTIRENNPELPIIILSRPKYRLNEEEKRRLAVIRKTYADTIVAGDKNTFFIDGPALMKYAKNEGTVDGCHPNDLGFHSMAKILIRQLKSLI